MPIIEAPFGHVSSDVLSGIPMTWLPRMWRLRGNVGDAPG